MASLSAIRRQLDRLLEPGAPPPAAGEIAQICQQWKQICDRYPTEIQGLIKDRIDQITRGIL